jgi:S1-C subfamily serine protease
MIWDPAQFTASLQEAAQTFDRPEAARLCASLVTRLLRESETYPAAEAEKVLQILRNKRWFDLMETVGEAVIRNGQPTARVRRQYAQALLDQGLLTAGFGVLRELVEDTSLDAGENAEAWGLMGRAYKQLYVDSGRPDFGRNQRALERAVASYWKVYERYRRRHLWHGVNVVALLARAEQDQIRISSFPKADLLAREILEAVKERETRREVSVWDFATAVEACLVLGASEEAVTWLRRYLEEGHPDAFELGSMLRQFTEVWRLDREPYLELGNLLLPAIRSALLAREGGQIELRPRQVEAEAQEQKGTGATLEKVLGATAFKTFQWYLKGVERCRGVARIGQDSARGMGTGFLFKGSDLHPKLGDSFLVVTNAHVVSDDANVNGALRPEDGVVIFESAGSKEYRIEQLLWTSPPHELDVSLLRLDPPPAFPDLPSYALARHLPLKDGKQRVYVIGHPGGGTLSLSLQDNILLDYDQRRLHYRAPTEGGSSGSPVFNEKWELIALHHAGGVQIPKLNGQQGHYAANEGISFHAIAEALVLKWG